MAIGALVGCGSSSLTGGSGGSTGSGKGGSTGSSGAFTTNLPAGTKVTALTTARAAQLCNELESYVDNNLFPALCQAASALSGPEAAYLDLLENPSASNSELQAACVSGAAMDAGSTCSYIVVDGGTDTCDISQIPSTCQATVGDYTKCINDTTAADTQRHASVPSCSTLTAASVTAYFAADGGSSAEPPEPASCSKFDATCDLVGGSNIMSNMSLRMMPKRRR